MHIFLVRHGQSYVNLSDLTYEHRDAPLTDLGRDQALAVASWLRVQVGPAELVSSTVSRARETALTIANATGVAPIWDDRLREVGTVRPDGSPIPDGELEPYRPEIWGTLRPYEPVTDSGESWMQVRARVGSFIESLIPARTRTKWPDSPEDIAENAAASPIGGSDADDRTVVVVCHAGVIEAFFEYVFEKGPWSVVEVDTNHTGISHLEHRPTPNRPDWRLHAHNRVEHLPPDLLTR